MTEPISMQQYLKYIFIIILWYAGPKCAAQEMPYALLNTYMLNERKIISPFVLKENKKPDTVKKSAILNQMLLDGEKLVREGRYNEAMLLYQRMLINTSSKSDYRLNIYCQMANLFQNAGSYRESVQMYYMAMGLTNDEFKRAKLYVNLSGLYLSLKDYDKSMQSLDRAIGLLENEGNGYWTALAFNNKGSVYNAKYQYDSGIVQFRKAYHASFSINPKEKSNPKEILDVRCLVLNNIADSYIKLNKPDSALHTLQMALPFFKETSQFLQCTMLLTLGEIYGCKGDDKTALIYLTQGLAIGETSGYAILNKESYESLALVNARLGRYKEAWKYQKKYTALNDKLISIENVHKINNLEREYDLSKRDKELARKELLISKQAGRLKEQNWLAGILILAVVSLCSIFLIFRRSHFNKQKLLKEQLNNTIKDRKIMQIEAGMKGEEKERCRVAQDLHDGVVSELLAMKLNLQAMGHNHAILKQSDDYNNVIYQAEEVTEKLRMVAHNLMPANVREQGLIHTIQAFLNRINNHKLQFTFLHYGEIPDFNDATIKIILMMTMELIQNILKHSCATEAMIQFNFFEDNMSITAEDNGVGINHDKSHKRGMGMMNIENNVRVLNGSLDIKSSEYTGTTMLIEIPLNEHTLKTANSSNP